MTYTNALLTISLFLLANLVTGVWWASKTNAILMNLTQAVKCLTDTMAKHEERYYSKVEAAKDFSVRDKQIEATFNKLDRLELTVSGMSR